MVRRRHIGAATLLTALATSAGAFPAHAAADPQLVMTPPATLSLLPESGESWNGTLQFGFGQSGPGTVRNRHFTFDATALRGIADFHSSNCTAKDLVFTCETSQAPGESELLPMIWLTAVPGTAVGATGALHITESADDAASVSADTQVTVGGPRLVVGQGPDQVTAKVGDTLARTVDVTNTGSLPATQLVVTVEAAAGLRLQREYGNCAYAGGGDPAARWPAAGTAICTIDSTVAPGETVHLDPLHFGVTSAAWKSDVRIHVKPAADPYVAALRKSFDYTPGTGPHLTAGRPEAPTPPVAPPADLDAQGGAGQFTVTTDSRGRLALTGIWAPRAGTLDGTLTVDLRNEGPAGLTGLLFNTLPDVFFTVPDGVDVIRSDGEFCSSIDQYDGVPLRAIDCNLDEWMPPGYHKTFTFTVKKTVPGGSIKLQLSNPQRLGQDAPILSGWEIDGSRDTAVVDLPSSPSASPSTSTSTSASTSASASPGTSAPTGAAAAPVAATSAAGTPRA
ncbi:hypothetical protein, partial [Kitasatospora nipponensis]